MRAMAMGAVAAVTLAAGGASAATLQSGYTWQANEYVPLSPAYYDNWFPPVYPDGEPYFFSATDPGEEFLDLLEPDPIKYPRAPDFNDLLLDFGRMVGADFFDYGITANDIYVHLYFADDDFKPVEIDGLPCQEKVESQGYATLAFDGSLKLTDYITTTREADPDGEGASCEFSESTTITDSFYSGAWSAVGDAPPFPFEQVASVPLPASVTLLGAALAGLGLLRRRVR